MTEWLRLKYPDARLKVLFGEADNTKIDGNGIRH